MRDRLIELLKGMMATPEITCPRFNKQECKGCKHDKGYACDVAGREADYLIENSVMALPCKVGDTVYEVSLKTKEVKKAEVCGFEISTGNEVSLVYYLDGNRCITSESLLKEANFMGKKLCLSEKEADEALSKLQASYEQVKGGRQE